MIDLGRAPLHAEGVTLFCDHANARLFHYISDRPRLRYRADGSPDLQLLAYRLEPELHDALGAGLLSLGVDLAVDDAALGRLRSRLARLFHLTESAQLSPVLADAGQVELVFVDRSSRDADAEGSTLVDRILGVGPPALYAENAASFQIVLSSEGVALVEGALRTGGLPAGVIYTLSVPALRPALRARITARWQQVYDYYENRLHGGKLLATVDIGETLEKLVESSAISLVIDELVPEADHAEVYARAIDRISDHILRELFKPTLGTSPPAESESAGLLEIAGRAVKDLLGAVSLTYTLREIQRSELKTLSYDLNVAEAELITLSPQGSLQTLLRPDGERALIDLGRLVTHVESAPSSELRFDIAAALDLGAEGIDRLEVDIQHGERREQLLLDAAQPRAEFRSWRDPGVGLAIDYRYTVHFRAGADLPLWLAAGSAGGVGANSPSLRALVSEVHTTEARVIRIDPREVYARPTLRAVARGIPFERFPTVFVDVEAAAPTLELSTEQTLELSSTTSEASLSVCVPQGTPVRFQCRKRYVDPNGVATSEEWQRVEPGILIVGNPFPDVLDVQILGSARFGTVVARIIVELRPLGHAERTAVRVLTRDAPSASWSYPLSDPGQHDYEYRVTLHTIRGEVREGKFLSGPGPKLVVGEGIARQRDVELHFVGRSFAAAGLLGIKVRFSFEDADALLWVEDELFVPDERTPVSWSYPVADLARQEYAYQLTLVHDDGQLETLEPVRSAALLLIHPLR